MTTALPHDLAAARAAWLAGDPAAWARYTACLHQLAAPTPTRPRAVRRPARPRARRAA